MTNCVGFEPISSARAEVLILGSLPGEESLRQRKYYARKQNCFWRIFEKLFDADPNWSYEERLRLLKKRHIALWDVCASAHRIGSLDANIRSPAANDFVQFFKEHKAIKIVCFNGQYAEKLFRQLVMTKTDLAIPQITLPSTSPAHAQMNFEKKLKVWRRALKDFL